MVTVNMHEAKTHLSKLVDRAVKGESFVIAKAGKPLVKVTALAAPTAPRRLGFLAGEIEVPEDFDVMGARELQGLFEEEGLLEEAAPGEAGSESPASGAGSRDPG